MTDFRIFLIVLLYFLVTWLFYFFFFFKKSSIIYIYKKKGEKHIPSRSPFFKKNLSITFCLNIYETNGKTRAYNSYKLITDCSVFGIKPANTQLQKINFRIISKIEPVRYEISEIIYVMSMCSVKCTPKHLPSHYRIIKVPNYNVALFNINF